MKTLTGVIALVLALLFAASNGVVAAEQKSPPTGVEKKQPATQPKVKLAMKGDYTRSTFKMTGKVTQVDVKAKTFTVISKGKAVAVLFDPSKLKVLPKVGEIIDITYTETPGRPMEATTINRVGPPPRPFDPKGLPVPPPPRPFDPKGLPVPPPPRPFDPKGLEGR